MAVICNTCGLPEDLCACGELAALVQAIADEFGITNMSDLIRWQKDDWVEFNFGSYPPVQLQAAEAAGFRADSNLRSLVINSLV